MKTLGAAVIFSDLVGSNNRITIIATAIIVAAIALTACGGDNDAPAAGPPPTAATALPDTPAPTATPAAAPPEELVVPVTGPEPGSDEALILAVLEKQMEALNIENFDLFTETCAPSGRNQLTANQVQYVFEGIWAAGKTKPHGYNVRNVEVKMLRAPFAQAELDFFYYEQHIDSFFQTWEKVDGDWYMEVFPCK